MMNVLHKKIRFALALVLICLLTPSAFATIHVISVGGSNGHSFVPSSLILNLGDTVKWQWDNGSHTTTSTTIPPNATTWSQNITSTQTTFVYVPTVPGTYNYKCIPHFSMGMVGSFTVVCAPLTQPTIANSGNDTVCEDDTSSMLMATVDPGVGIQWKLNGNPISGATANQYLPQESGTYTCTVKNLCDDSLTSNSIMMTVLPSPDPMFTYTHSGVAYTFTNTTTQTAGLSWLWNFGDGDTSTEENPQHTYDSAGTYMVVLTAMDTSGNGCSGVISQNISTNGTEVDNILKTKEDYVISPNPTDRNIIRVSLKKDEEAAFKVYDIAGRLINIPKVIRRGNQAVWINVGQLSTGNYLLKIIVNSKRSYTRKLSIIR